MNLISKVIFLTGRRIQRTMELRLDASVFRWLIVLPIAMCTLLCAVLAFGIRSVERRSLAVDAADVQISHAENVMKLMVDEETGLRGYLLTKNLVFLQPFDAADREINSEFSSLLQSVQYSPDQLKLLDELRTEHQDWVQEAKAEISAPSSNEVREDFLLQRKAKMDDMRLNIDRFMAWAEDRRSLTLSKALRFDHIILFSVVDLAILIAALLTWQTQRVLRNTVQTHLRLQSEMKQRSS